MTFLTSSIQTGISYNADYQYHICLLFLHCGPWGHESCENISITHVPRCPYLMIIGSLRKINLKFEWRWEIPKIPATLQCDVLDPPSWLAGWLEGKVAPAGGEVSCLLILVPGARREVWWIPREVRCHWMRIPGRFRASPPSWGICAQRGSVPPATQRLPSNAHSYEVSIQPSNQQFPPKKASHPKRTFQVGISNKVLCQSVRRAFGLLCAQIPIGFMSLVVVQKILFHEYCIGHQPITQHSRATWSQHSFCSMLRPLSTRGWAKFPI